MISVYIVLLAYDLTKYYTLRQKKAALRAKRVVGDCAQEGEVVVGLEAAVLRGFA